ncbi:MAG: alpha/beta hydrolase, partial [Ginsengibacter sp.]
MKKNKVDRTPKQKVIRWGRIMIFLYGAAGIALYYLQEKLLFHPTPLPSDYQYKFDVPFKEVNISLNATDNLNLVRFFPKDAIPKGVVLYFHGNRGNINRYAKYTTNFTKHGYEVWITDYPGYGKTTGKFTEENVYMQAREIYKLANTKFNNGSIIVYGKSLGSGIA